jgi:eukaryotic-like serine/threonine-protein kinase
LRVNSRAVETRACCSSVYEKSVGTGTCYHLPEQMPAPPDEEDEPFRRVAGTWRLARVIAVGGIGEVWRAVSLSDPLQTVAVKRLHSHLARQEAIRQMFRAEQQLCLSLPPHPNLLRGLAADDDDALPYLVTALAPGADLRTHVQTAPLAPGPAMQIISQVAAAVAHLHDHGWVHGDIGPSNVVVDGIGGSAVAVTLCDLGVARRIGDAGPVRGTHAYMAPEQIRGEAWMPATDVFALGVCLWELLNGQRLFHRGQSYLTMAAVMDFEPPMVSDPSTAAIVNRALQKDPRQRMQNAHEFLAAIDVIAVSSA